MFRRTGIVRLRPSWHRDRRVVVCGNRDLVQESVRHSHVTACECRCSETLATRNSAGILVCRLSIVLAHVRFLERTRVAQGLVCRQRKRSAVFVVYVAAGVPLMTASTCRADVSESICRPHAVVECATGKLLSVRVTARSRARAPITQWARKLLLAPPTALYS